METPWAVNSEISGLGSLTFQAVFRVFCFDLAAWVILFLTSHADTLAPQHCSDRVVVVAALLSEANRSHLISSQGRWLDLESKIGTGEGASALYWQLVNCRSKYG